MYLGVFVIYLPLPINKQHFLGNTILLPCQELIKIADCKVKVKLKPVDVSLVIRLKTGRNRADCFLSLELG